jgi:hypothetical protein
MNMQKIHEDQSAKIQLIVSRCVASHQTCKKIEKEDRNKIWNLKPRKIVK